MYMMLGGGVLAITLVIGVFIFLNIAKASVGEKTADDCNKARDPATGACKHIQNGVPLSQSEFDPYSSDPPTSGPHWPAPAPRGIYTEEPDERLVHSLEHGYLVINVKCNTSACPDDYNKLVSIYQDYPSKVILNYRPATPNKIAVTAWTRILRLDAMDEGKIKKFIDAYRGGGSAPEPRAE